MALPLPDDFREFLKLLNKNRVKYLLIGGYAVAHYGHVRNTADMDVWVEATIQNARRVVKSLQEFGFDGHDVVASLFTNPRKVVRMGVSPLRLEILTSISGVTFDKCYKRMKLARMGSQRVKLIDLRDLIINKKASGRDKDLLDVKELLRKSKPT
jgi:predicted nucleotidyltransferase